MVSERFRTNGVHEDVEVRIAECSRQLSTLIGLLSLNVMLCSSQEKRGGTKELALTESRLEVVEEN